MAHGFDLGEDRGRRILRFAVLGFVVWIGLVLVFGIYGYRALEIREAERARSGPSSAGPQAATTEAPSRTHAETGQSGAPVAAQPLGRPRSLGLGLGSIWHDRTIWGNRLYLAMQLFWLHSERLNLEEAREIPESLLFARLLAAVVELGILLAAFTGIATWLLPRARAFLFRHFASRPVVICGLGRKGLQLVRDFRGRGESVAVIEKDEETHLVATALDLGAVVLFGDATKPEILHKAAIHRAKHLIAICGHDGTNVEIAAAAENLLSRRPGTRLDIYVHIVDLELRAMLRRHKTMNSPHSCVRVNVFNVFENAARLLFRDNFLDHPDPITTEHDPRHAHLVVIGFGPVGESLVLQAVRLAHFPNEKKLCVTVVDKEAERRRRRLLTRYENLEQLCNITFIESEAEDPQLLRNIGEWCSDPKSIVTLVVCFDDDSHSFSYGLNLLKQLLSKQRPTPIRIFVRIESQAGLATLIPPSKDDATGQDRICAFAQLEQTCSAGVVVDEKLNASAKKIHEKFSQQRITYDHRSKDDASVQSWDVLDPDLKESNCHQYDHLRPKLRAMGCDIAPATKRPSGITDEVVDEIAQDEKLKLARMEHRRWMTERFLAGWKYGEVKSIRERTNPYLKPWGQLTDDVKAYDFDAVGLILQLVEWEGKEIRRIQKTRPRAQRVG